MSEEREWSRSPSPLKMASMSQIMADADKDSAQAGGGTTPGRQLTRAEKMEQKRKTAKGDALELPGFSLDAFAMASSQPSAVFAQQATSTTAVVSNSPASKQSRRRSSRGDSPKQSRQSENVNKQQTSGHEPPSKQSPAKRPKPTPRTKQQQRTYVQNEEEEEDDEPPMLDSNIPRKVARRSSGASKSKDSAAQSPADAQSQQKEPPSALRVQPRSQDKDKSLAAVTNGTSAATRKAPRKSARSSQGRLSTFGVAHELDDAGDDDVNHENHEDRLEAGPSQSPDPPAPPKPAARSSKNWFSKQATQHSSDPEVDVSDDQTTQSRSRAAPKKKQPQPKGSKKRVSNENERAAAQPANKRRKADGENQPSKKGKTVAAQKKGKQKAPTPVDEAADDAQSQEGEQLEPEPEGQSEDEEAPEPAPTKRAKAKATPTTVKEKPSREPKKKASASSRKDSKSESKNAKNAKGKGKATEDESEVEVGTAGQSQAPSKKSKQPRGKEKDASVPPGFGDDAKEAGVPSGTTRFLSIIEPHFDDAVKNGLPDDVAADPQVSKVFKRLIKAWKKGVTGRVKELRLSVAIDAKSEAHTKLANDLRKRQMHIEQIARDQEAEEGYWEESRAKKRLTHRLHEYAVNLESSAQDASSKQALADDPDTYDLESSLRIFESLAAPQQTVSAHKSHGGDAAFGANPDLDGTTFNDRLQRWNELFQMKLDKADEEAEGGASE